MLLTDVMTYLMKGTLTNVKGVLKGDGKILHEIGVDVTPTANSKNLVESGAVKSALDDKQNKITSSGVLIGDGSGGVLGKTLDTSTLTDDNDHVPTSGVVKSALDDVAENAKVYNKDSTFDPSATKLPSDFPTGITIQRASSSTLYPTEYGIIVTFKNIEGRGFQIAVPSQSYAQRIAIRSDSGGTGWTNWCIYSGTLQT